MYFTNGVLTTAEDAFDNLGSLISETHTIRTDYSIQYDNTYNDDEEFWTQLHEVHKQRVENNSSLFWDWAQDIASAPDWFKEQAKAQIEAITARAISQDEDLQNHIEQYQTAIKNCNRVLIVSHSQGNFYANHAWTAVYSGKDKSNKYNMQNIPAIGIVSVASPAGNVGRSLLLPDDHKPYTNYTTLTNDYVVRLVQALGFEVLEPNVTNKIFNLVDLSNHNFIDSYMRGRNSKEKIVKDITDISSKIETLPVQRTEVNSSYIKSMEYVNQQFLEVELAEDGSIYRYYDVPNNVIEMLPGAGDAAKDMLAIYKNRLVCQGNTPDRILAFYSSHPFQTKLFNLSTREITTHEGHPSNLEALNGYEISSFSDWKANQPFLGKDVEGQTAYQIEGDILVNYTDGSTTLIDHSPIKLVNTFTLNPNFEGSNNPFIKYFKHISLENLDYAYPFLNRYTEENGVFKTMKVGDFTIVPIRRYTVIYVMSDIGEVNSEGFLNVVNSYLILDENGQIIEQLFADQPITNLYLFHFQKKID